MKWIKTLWVRCLLWAVEQAEEAKKECEPDDLLEVRCVGDLSKREKVQPILVGGIGLLRCRREDGTERLIRRSQAIDSAAFDQWVHHLGGVPECRWEGTQ